MPLPEALERARRVVSAAQDGSLPRGGPRDVPSDHEVVGGAWSAAVSSFLFFASGAIIPVLPWIVGLSGVVAVVIALVLVGIALLATGATVGLLSGGPPLRRALRQLVIGFGAAAVTYVLGWAFGVSLG
jgi:VIT1/CCC1 family predicted Fe2+/Mn2+ transporter